MSTRINTYEQTTTARYQGIITPADESIPYRLVGAYEYSKCLENFDRLVKISSAEQIKIYDKFLKERPEFMFFNGMNIEMNRLPDLLKLGAKGRNQFNDRFLQQGLPWMMALARIELGAIRSMYSKDAYPFETVVHSPIGRAEYLRLLANDAAAHLKALRNDRQFQLTRMRTADPWTIAYYRRAKVILDMMKTVRRIGDRQTTQLTGVYYDEATAHELRLYTIIKNFLEQQSSEKKEVYSTGPYNVKLLEKFSGQCTELTAGRIKSR